MNVLVDTSVWVDHFRGRNSALVALLQLDLVMIHPMVLAEIACGTLPAPRAKSLEYLGLLRISPIVPLLEVVDFIERERLYGLGCGVIDMSLLASTLVTPGATLWTLDRRLDALANRFGVAYRPT